MIVDPNRAVTNIKKVDRNLGQLEKRAVSAKRALGAAFALAGLGAGLTAVVRVMSEFSQEVSTVQAVTQATGEEIAALEAEFKLLGSTTRFSASQAAEGATFLARAGFDAAEVLESLDDALTLAQAGALGLAEAADIASNVLTGFRLETSEAARVVDVLALAANSANTDVSQLGQALKFVAPVAAGVGVALEETTAAISALSNAGLQASLAGTGLRRILSELESPSSKTEAILATMSLTADDVRVSSVGLTVALQRLADAGVDTGTALELFGDRGGPAFEVLRSSIPAVEAMTLALQDADGTAARIAATMDDNLNGALLSVRSATEGFVLALGDAGRENSLEASARSLADALRFLGENVNAVVQTTLLLGAGFAILKLAPLINKVATATTAFGKLQVVLVSGRAVTLGSANATRLQALSELRAAQAAVRRTKAQIDGTKAAIFKIGVEKQATGGMLSQSVAIERLTILEGKNALATDAAAAAQARLAAATGLAAAKAKLASIAMMTVGGPLTLLVAGATAAFFALKKLNKEFDEIDAILAETDGLIGQTEFGLIGDEILRVERSLANVNKQIALTGEEWELGARKAKQLEDRLALLRIKQDNLTGATKKAQEAAQKQAEAVAAVNLGFDASIEKLEQEAFLLSKSTEEREIHAELLKTIASIEKEGAALKPEQKETLEATIRRNAALRDQTALLDDLNSEQDELTRKTAAFNALHEAGALSPEQTREGQRDLGFDVGATDAERAAGIETVNAQLAEQERLILMGKDARQVEIAALKIEQDLRKQGIELGETEGKALRERIAGLQELASQGGAGRAELIAEVNTQLAEEERLLKMTKDAREVSNEATRIEQDLLRQGVVLNETEQENLRLRLASLQALGRQAELLREGVEPLDAAAQAQADLLLLQEQGIITADEYAAALERLNAKQGNLTGFDAVKASFGDVAKEAGLTKEAIADFALSGGQGFEEFTQSILENAKRILAEKAISALLDGLFGAAGGGGAAGAGGLLAGIFGGGKAEGGAVNPNQTFLVGEEGPELFTPPGSGNIVPAGETAAALSQPQAPQVNVAPPQVNVAITNVSDPNEIKDAVESGALDDTIMNVVQRKRRVAKGILG